MSNLEEWFDRGLGRHVEVRDESLSIIWEGFVNQVQIDAGGRSVTRGPLIEIGNKVRAVYTPVESTARSPYLAGHITSTAWVTDTISTARYGTIEKVLSTSDKIAASATQTAETWLADNKDPQTTHRISSTQGANPQVTISCAGYKEWLKAYTYYSATTGTRTIALRLADVLAADINALFTTPTHSIAANTLTLPYEQQTGASAMSERLALSVIQEAVVMGDASGNDYRYTFGVYAGRKATYEAVPTTHAYVVRMNAYGTQFTTPSGATVHPWQLKPAEWVFDADFLVGRVRPTADLRQDPRYVFIEQVSYSAPYGVQLSGGKIDRISQRMARLGLAGAA